MRNTRVRVASRLLAKSVRDKKGCLIWRGYNLGAGYGGIWITDRWRTTHRAAAWVWLKFDWNKKKFVCHSCNNKLCIEPKHLYIADHKTNCQHAVRDGLVPRGSKHHLSTLREKQVRSMRAAYAKGIIIAELARKHKVTENAVRQVVWRRSWKHI